MNAVCMGRYYIKALRINLFSSFEQIIYLFSHKCLMSHRNYELVLVRHNTAERKVENETL